MPRLHGRSGNHARDGVLVVQEETMLHRIKFPIAAALVLAACSDNVTQPRTAVPTGPDALAARQAPTTTISEAVTGTATNALGVVGTFTGTATIVGFATNAAGQLVATVQVTGSALIAGVTTAVSQTTTTTVVPAGTCPVLALDLGAIHLDVLGLVVDLSAVNLDIVAQSGPGKLVGNLLCAVVNLLNGGGSTTGLNALLDLLNNLLG
jgi:hypothetical protein